MNDCIHLHACRRIQSIGRTNRLNCTEDCEAYQSKKEKTDYVSIREALDFAAEGGRWVEDYGTDGAFDINDLLVVRASV